MQDNVKTNIKKILPVIFLFLGFIKYHTVHTSPDLASSVITLPTPQCYLNTTFSCTSKSIDSDVVLSNYSSSSSTTFTPPHSLNGEKKHKMTDNICLTCLKYSKSKRIFEL